MTMPSLDALTMTVTVGHAPFWKRLRNLPGIYRNYYGEFREFGPVMAWRALWTLAGVEVHPAEAD